MSDIENTHPSPLPHVMGDGLAQAGRDIRILLAQIDWLEELTGENLEDEDAAIVEQIRQSWLTSDHSRVEETGDLRDQKASLMARGIDPNLDHLPLFEFSKGHEFIAIGDERPNVVVHDPAPRCKIALRRDTGDWFVATGVFFKPVRTEDGTTFKDVDGGIWRLVVSGSAALAATSEGGE